MDCKCSDKNLYHQTYCEPLKSNKVLRELALATVAGGYLGSFAYLCSIIHNHYKT